MIAMPCRSASRGESSTTSSPRTRRRPLDGRSTPARIFINVDFPAPFSPINTFTAPG
jgi:hypothetical protein